MFFFLLFTPRHFQGSIITEFKFLLGMNQFLRCWYFCLFGCSAINFDKGTRENHGNVFSWVNLVGRLSKRKIGKIVNYDQARGNGGSNYEYPGPRLVPTLVGEKVK